MKVAPTIVKIADPGGPRFILRGPRTEAGVDTWGRKIYTHLDLGDFTTDPGEDPPGVLDVQPTICVAIAAVEGPGDPNDESVLEFTPAELGGLISALTETYRQYFEFQAHRGEA